MTADDLALTPLELALGFALALATGGAVGLERERHAIADKKPTFGGARTFPLVALLGALSALIARELGPSVFALGLAAVTALLGLGYWGSRREAGSVQLGLTSELAAIVVFAIGAIPFLPVFGEALPQRLVVGGALGTVVMSLLALRRPIHELAERLSYDDLLATVRFALASVVVLPLLPDRSFGPYDVLNPFRIGAVVVLIAGISFTGYVAVRLWGERKGLEVTALAGGLVSSTAVTLTFSARGRAEGRLAPACALAINLAATVMFARVLVLVAVIRPGLTAAVGVPVGAMLVAGAVGCLLSWRRVSAATDQEPPAGLRNPFRMRQALRLGLVFAVVRFASAAAWDRLGASGLIASAGLAGLADVDAITISVARMHLNRLSTSVAVTAITAASVVNTLVKLGLAAALGGASVARGVARVLLPATIVGLIAAWLGASLLP